ncbi:MAG: spondin domain-containing protein [Limisphaerales bacterium]
MSQTPAFPTTLRSISAWAGACCFLTALVPVQAADIRVTIQNLSPADGTLLTPVWVGFHDGAFDLYDRGAAASPSLERLAEDGATGFVSADFAAHGGGGVDGTIAAGPFPPFAPGAAASMDFSLDPLAPGNRYFSYASMVIPSNDAFIANGNPLAFQIFGPGGEFLGADFIVSGAMVLDAGTEVNDELPANTAFFGQAAPNTGDSQGGVVDLHGGFLPAGSGGILDGGFAGFSFAQADFLAPNYALARITVSVVPEGSTWMMAGTLGAGIVFVGLRRRRSARA